MFDGNFGGGSSEIAAIRAATSEYENSQSSTVINLDGVDFIRLDQNSLKVGNSHMITIPNGNCVIIKRDLHWCHCYVLSGTSRNGYSLTDFYRSDNMLWNPGYLRINGATNFQGRFYDTAIPLEGTDGNSLIKKICGLTEGDIITRTMDRLFCCNSQNVDGTPIPDSIKPHWQMKGQGRNILVPNGPGELLEQWGIQNI